MSKRKSEIVVDAEFTPVEEVQPAAEQPQATFNLDDVAEMVIVGRKKDGTEFVQAVGTDDALKAKAYAQYAVTHYDLIIEQAIYSRIRGE